LTGTPSPDFTLLDVNGQQRNVSEWKGKVLVLNFWATWCPPCLEEIPYFIKLQKQYGQQGLQFVGIALESVNEVLGFASEQGINYPLLVGEQAVIRLAGKFGNQNGGLPYTVVLDREGRISFIKQGPLSTVEAEHVITSLL
jgi:peroxiredoxin